MGIKNKSQFAKKVNVSRQTLYKYIDEGMPLESEEAACAWIEVNYGSGGGKNLNTSAEKKGANFDAENVPGIEVGEDDIKRDDVIGVLARKRKNEKIAWGLLADALNSRDLGRIAGATRHYNLCSDARLKTEADLIDLQNTEAQLASKAQLLAKDAALKIIRPLRQMLKSMPSRCAQRCNPAAQELAREVLEDEVDQLFEKTYLGKD